MQASFAGSWRVSRKRSAPFFSRQQDPERERMQVRASERERERAKARKSKKERTRERGREFCVLISGLMTSVKMASIYMCTRI